MSLSVAPGLGREADLFLLILRTLPVVTLSLREHLIVTLVLWSLPSLKLQDLDIEMPQGLLAAWPTFQLPLQNYWHIFLFFFLKQYIFVNIYLLWLQWVSVAALGIFSCGRPTLSWGMWDLALCLGSEPRPPVLGVWSLSHWTSREVPHVMSIYLYLPQNLSNLKLNPSLFSWFSPNCLAPLFLMWVNITWGSQSIKCKRSLGTFLFFTFYIYPFIHILTLTEHLLFARPILSNLGYFREKKKAKIPTLEKNIYQGDRDWKINIIIE